MIKTNSSTLWNYCFVKVKNGKNYVILVCKNLRSWVPWIDKIINCNKLCILRNNLQEQFYDYNNGRRPTLWTEDALRLLAKYKPTALKDMANISGIGDSFIDNFGTFFYLKY